MPDARRWAARLEGGVAPPCAPGLLAHGFLREEARRGEHRSPRDGAAPCVYPLERRHRRLLGLDQDGVQEGVPGEAARAQPARTRGELLPVNCCRSELLSVTVQLAPKSVLLIRHALPVSPVPDKTVCPFGPMGSGFLSL